MREKEKKQKRENFEFQQWHHQNSCCPILLTKKPIVAMSLPKYEKKDLCRLWQCHCQKWEEKKIVVAEITCEKLKKKKKSAMSTIFLQQFHNKSQVISYY